MNWKRKAGIYYSDCGTFAIWKFRVIRLVECAPWRLCKVNGAILDPAKMHPDHIGVLGKKQKKRVHCCFGTLKEAQAYTEQHAETI